MQVEVLFLSDYIQQKKNGYSLKMLEKFLNFALLIL